MTRRYRALLLDLFGTVVHFRTPVPFAGGPAYEWLRAPLAARAPDLSLEALSATLLEVSRQIAAERPPHFLEIQSPERFRRALERLAPGRPHDDVAVALSRAHMAHLADQTELPPAHAPLLRDLAAAHRLGLVSNFDHGPTARAILDRHAIAPCFESVVISAEHGRRKPHPAIFAAALDQLDVAPAEALYVGDTHEDDVVGALAAGLDVAWLDRRGREAEPSPTYRLESLNGLRDLLLA